MIATADMSMAANFAGYLRFEKLRVQISSSASDKELVRWARRGQSDAITLLVERYSPRLHRYLIRLAGSTTLAEDLLQDTWLRVMERLDSFRTDRPFAPWLFTVARNRAIDVLRKQSRQGHQLKPRATDEGSGVDPVEMISDNARSVLDQLTDDDLYKHAELALNALQPELQEVICLRFQEEMKLDVMARLLGLPPSTVKSRLYRGLEQLRLQMEHLR